MSLDSLLWFQVKKKFDAVRTQVLDDLSYIFITLSLGQPVLKLFSLHFMDKQANRDSLLQCDLDTFFIQLLFRKKLSTSGFDTCEHYLYQLCLIPLYIEVFHVAKERACVFEV